MLAKAKTSLLTPADVTKLHFRPFVEGHELDIKPSWAGFQIPYFKLDGRLDTGFYRFRFTQTKPSKGFASVAEEPAKPRRYSQPANTNCGVYLPPMLPASWVDIAADPKYYIVITEGELKAAAGCKVGHPTLGLGGVYSWRSAKQQQSFLPILEKFVWDGRTVTICFDSDITTNVMVRIAASRLAAALAERGAIVRWAALPSTEEGEKQGMDDFLLAYGEEAFQDVLDTAEEAGPGAPFQRMNTAVAVIRETGEVVELHTGNVWSTSVFSETVYKHHTFIEYRAAEKGGTNAKELRKYTAKEWLSWPLRAEVPALAYDPSCERELTNDGSYNTWYPQRWALVPSNKGDIALWEQLFSHLFGGLSKEDQLWAKQWLACPIQRPGTKLATAMLVWSRTQGTGKTLFGETMRHIYGANYGTVTSLQLAGQFTEWAHNKQFIVSDEISLGDKRGVTSMLKDIITRSSLRMNIKNRKSYSIRDCINYYFTSNHEDAVYLDERDRRFFVVHANVNPLPPAFYKEYGEWLRKDGPARLYYYLLNEVDLTGFDSFGQAPITAAKQEMTASSRGDVEDWCVQLATDPNSLLHPDRHPQGLWRTEDLLRVYDPDQKQRVKSIGMGRALASAGIVRVCGGSNNVRIGGARTRLWIVRNAEKYSKLSALAAAKVYEQERPNLYGAVGGSAKFAPGVGKVQ